MGHVDSTQTSSTAAGTLDIQLWSDVVCPWCWIGEARLAQALEATGYQERAQITVRSFQLDPSAKRAPTLEHLAAKFGKSPAEARAMTEQVRTLGAELDLPMDFEAALNAPTADAHRLIKFAGETGLGMPLMQRLHRLHFAEGADVSDHATLLAAATELGLDPDGAAAVLESTRYAEEVWDDQLAAGSYGVQGVPFFLLAGVYGVSGAQPIAVLEQALEVAANHEA
jgi:predicted DsbA family dithiol-disulfide isomerase